MSVRSPTKSMKKARKGFSLPEILVACAIIVAMSSCAVATADNLMRMGRYNAAKASVASISVAVAKYRFETGSLPVDLPALTNPANNRGPWLNANELVDPWNQNYNYYVPENGNTYAIWSNGPDRTNNSGNPTTDFSSDDIGIISQ